MNLSEADVSRRLKRERLLFILIIAAPFCWLLVNVLVLGRPFSFLSVITTFLPCSLILPLFLFVRRGRRRSTRRSDTGFCSACGHEIPPGIPSGNCQECGAALAPVRDNKFRLEMTPSLFWAELIFMLFFPLSLMAPSISEGPTSFFGFIGSGLYGHLPSSTLVFVADSDPYGSSAAWTELQTRTLTAEQLDRLAGIALAYREDPEVRSYFAQPSENWFSVAIGNDSLSSPILTRVIASSDPYNDPTCSTAFGVLASRTLSVEEQAALLEVLFTALEDPERRLDIRDDIIENWFANQEAAGTLTPEQLDRARACNWIPELDVPDRVRVGEPFEIIVGQSDRFGSSGSLLSQRWTTIAIDGLAIDGGPFEDPDLEPMLVLYSASVADREQNRPRERFFSTQLVFDEPGTHVIRIRYVLFDGQRSGKRGSVERAADGSLILPAGAGWIVERVLEHTVVVEDD